MLPGAEEEVSRSRVGDELFDDSIGEDEPETDGVAESDDSEEPKDEEKRPRRGKEDV
jgi:hypothetical protein